MAKQGEGRQSVGPLDGIKVLDFSGFIAGCYAAMIMGDFGADVIKIEPLTGDGARNWGPFLVGESRFFQGWNRNKRSIALDLRSEEGVSIAHEMVGSADVVVENFRPGITAKLKIDYATLSAINPKIIYSSITAFGTKGPYGKRPGYDPIIQAMSGAARANERYCQNVGICSVAVNDYGAGMLTLSGVMAALYHRERTGEGQRVETSLLQAAMSIQNHSFCQSLEHEEEPPFGIYPYRFFDTKDDIIFVAGPTDKFWRLLCSAAGLSGLGEDKRYESNVDRVNHSEELTAILEAKFREKTTKEWESILIEAGVPCGPALTYEEFFENPQVEAMGMRQVVEHSSIGPIRLAGVPVDMEKTPAAIVRAAPLLGEHTREILAEEGYTKEEIEALIEEGTVGSV